MRNLVIIIATIATVPATAGVFATAGIKNDFQGKTVLTTESCSLDITTVASNFNQAEFKRAFYMTGDGKTSEGCWKSEHGSVVLIWPSENVMRRWPIKNFKLNSNGWD